MMNALTTTLEACDPAPGRFRTYRVEAGTDLLGDWLVDLTYGRIDTLSRTIRHAVRDKVEARETVRHCLQRRATARKRIGVGCQPPRS